MSSEIQELQLVINGLKIAALSTSSGKPPGAPKLLCVHGWLDNANSFTGLMGELKDADIVAIDLPGHGHSGHLPPESDYHMTDMPFLLLEIAKELGWQQFHLVGHSLGGCIATLTAAAAPDLIESLVLIEASGPVTEPPQALPDRLKKARAHRDDNRRFQSRTFSKKEEAVMARLAAAKMSPESALLIIERQLKEVPGGYHWRFDPRQRMASPVYLTEEQVLAVLSAIEAQTLVVEAEDGYLATRAATQNRLQQICSCTVARVPGHHHMHMDDPGPTADAIKKHLGQ